MRLSGAHQRAAKHRIDMFLKGSDCSFLEHINCIIISGKRIGFITFLQIGIFLQKIFSKKVELEGVNLIFHGAKKLN